MQPPLGDYHFSEGFSSRKIVFTFPNWVNTSVPTYLKNFINSTIVQKEEGKKSYCVMKIFGKSYENTFLKHLSFLRNKVKCMNCFFVSWLTKWFIATMRYFDHISIKQVWTFNWKNKNNSIRKINFDYLLSKRHWTWPQNTRQAVMCNSKLFGC